MLSGRNFRVEVVIEKVLRQGRGNTFVSMKKPKGVVNGKETNSGKVVII